MKKVLRIPKEFSRDKGRFLFQQKGDLNGSTGRSRKWFAVAIVCYSIIFIIGIFLSSYPINNFVCLSTALLCFGTMVLGYFLFSELWFKRTVKNIRIYTSGIELNHDESVKSKFIHYSAFEKILKGSDIIGLHYTLNPKKPSRVRVRIRCSTPGAMKYLPTIKAQIDRHNH